MRAFLLSFNDAVVSRPAMLQFLDTRPEVLNWYAPLQGGVFIISNSNSQALAALIREAFSHLYFVIAELHEVTTMAHCRLRLELINNPTSSGRWIA